MLRPMGIERLDLSAHFREGRVSTYNQEDQNDDDHRSIPKLAHLRTSSPGLGAGGGEKTVGVSGNPDSTHFQPRNPGDKRTLCAAVIYIGTSSIAQLASSTETSRRYL